jgi:hypothetical protein
MDFNRGGLGRPSSTPAATTQPAQKPTVASAATRLMGSGNFKQSKLYRLSFLALLASGTILFVAMIFFIIYGTPINRESRYVEGGQYQAVFVNVNGTNGGQVYFGKVTAMTPQYIRLTNVFYIQNQQSGDQSSASAYNLVKLGCELHGPKDEMVINRDQVFFWENLKSDSQVAQKAAEFYKQNPNGQKCNANSNSTQQSNTTTQNSANTGSGTSTTPQSSSTGTTGTTNGATTPSTNSSTGTTKQ